MKVRAAVGCGLGFVLLALLPAGSGGQRGSGTGPAPGARTAAAIAEMEDPGVARDLFLRRRLPAGERELPVARTLAAQLRMRAMAHRAESWTSLGPGNIGGRTRALVIDPVRPRTMYAAGVDGGVWKTVNGGASWTPLTDLLASLAVSSLAMDPGNRRVLYAGTGEGFGNADALRGAGIFKTADGGASWTRLEATGSADFAYVNRLLVSPRDSSRVYAATGTGLFRSPDAGATWIQILDPGTATGCLDLAIRPGLPDGADAGADDLVFVSCGNFDQATVYRNPHANRGGHWRPVLSEPGMGRTSLAIAPSQPSVVYALAASNEPGPGGLYYLGLHALFRSDAAGAPGSFVAQVRNTDPPGLGTVLLTSTRFAFQHDCGAAAANAWSGRGWYDNAIAVDPVDPDRVWVGGVDLFRSDDGGRTWGLASYWWAGEAAGAASGFAHADQHALVFHPRYDGVHNRLLFVAGDGGVYRTADALAPVAGGPDAPCHPADSAFVWTALNNGYGVTQFYHGAAFPDGSSYLGGSQDTGVVLGSDAAGPDGWQHILGSDGGQVAIDPADPGVLYAESLFLTLQKSADGGATFKSVVAGLSGNFGPVAPFRLDPGVPHRLWIGGSEIWRSDDGAAHWTLASPTLAGNGLDSITALAVSPPDTAGATHVLAGTASGAIFHNDGSAAALAAGAADGRNTAWPFALPRVGYLSSLTFDPTTPVIAYATYSTYGGQHVWRSGDGGATWQALDGLPTAPGGSLPDLPVHTLAVDPRHAERLYIGTDLGIFVSLDGGATWAVEDAAFANVEAAWLTIGPGPGGRLSLFAFTHGRGAWRAVLPD